MSREFAGLQGSRDLLLTRLAVATQKTGSEREKEIQRGEGRRQQVCMDDVVSLKALDPSTCCGVCSVPPRLGDKLHP